MYVLKHFFYALICIHFVNTFSLVKQFYAKILVALEVFEGGFFGKGQGCSSGVCGWLVRVLFS